MSGTNADLIEAVAAALADAWVRAATEAVAAYAEAADLQDRLPDAQDAVCRRAAAQRFADEFVDLIPGLLAPLPAAVAASAADPVRRLVRAEFGNALRRLPIGTPEAAVAYDRDWFRDRVAHLLEAAESGAPLIRGNSDMR